MLASLGLVSGNPAIVRHVELPVNLHGSIEMPATSKAQQKAAGAALSAKRGDTKKSELKGASKGMYESMSEKQLEDFAETKRKGLPEHADDKD